MKELSSRIPNRLRKHRKIMGYSQNEVAKIFGFKTASKISRWERGLAMPSVKNLLKLSVLYATLPSELYFEFYQEVKHLIHKKKKQFE